MTDLEVYRPPASEVAQVADIDSWTRVASQVIKLANEICDTPFVPVGLRGSAPATAAAILAGREMGLGPFTSLQHFHVIKGKVGQSALLMRALIVGQGHQWEDVEVTDTRAVVKGRRKGEAEWATASFTADQARKAGIDLGGYPQDKLYARATSRLARRKFADVIMGMPYSAEELEDGELPTDVGTQAASSNGSAASAEAKAPPRTARRKAAAGDKPRSQHAGAQAPRPAEENGAEPAPAAAGAAPSRGEQPLPPLPGEDEQPGNGDRHRKLVGVVRAHFKRLGYTDDDDEVRLQDTAALAGTSEIGSTNDLDEDELKAVADTLARCRDVGQLKTLLDAARDGGSDG